MDICNAFTKIELFITEYLGRFNSYISFKKSQVVTIQDELLSPDDLFLFGVESLIVVGIAIAIVIAFLVYSRYPTLTSRGWIVIITGLIFIMLHSIFDALDTLQFDDIIVDVLNILDGSTFVIGLILFALGIYMIAEYGAEQWGL